MRSMLSSYRGVVKLSEQCRLQQRDMEVLVEQAVYDEETPQFDPWTSEQGEISDDVNTSCVIKAPETAHSRIQCQLCAPRVNLMALLMWNAN